MSARKTPAAWRRAFSLFRRRVAQDSFGNEVAQYDMTQPDAQFSAADGICFQSPRSWNSAAQIGSAGLQVQACGEVPGGVLEAYLFDDTELAELDRILLDDALYELRSIRRWPSHRELLLQRVR